MALRRKRRLLVVLTVGVSCLAGGLVVPAADARPAKCFGKKINRVVSASGKRVRLKYRDVAWVSGNRVTVIGRPHTVVCAGRGRQTVIAGKGHSLVSTGPGNDRIILHRNSVGARVYAGPGNDYIRGSKNHDLLYASSPGDGARGADRDVVYGRGGNDRIYDYGGVGNRLYGEDGVDRIYSLGSAVSSVYGGNGSDLLFTNGGRSGSRTERLFGERGNDRLRGDRLPVNGPAYLDGGPGDDWIYGTDRDDTIITQSGITKIAARGGDDLILSSSRGQARIDGGSGRDTVSFMSHTPPQGGSGGVTVNLQAGSARGQFFRAPSHSLTGIENAEGSPFDDVLIGRLGSANVLEGGLGDDDLYGDAEDPDSADGGLGENRCEGFGRNRERNCNKASPGSPDGSRPVVDINRSGILTVLGAAAADRIKVGYEASAGRYRVDLNRAPVLSGRCDSAGDAGTVVRCEAAPGNLSNLVVHSGEGDDRVEIGPSVPAAVTTSINGGSGRNALLGGKTKDFMQTTEGASAGSVLKGGANSDVIIVNDAVTVAGGPGADVIHNHDPCAGGRVSGGGGRDNLAFAGSLRGVDVNLARGTATWFGGSCRQPLKISHDVESLEGTPHRDRLALGRRFRAQTGRGSLLGREGADILDSRNGVQDSVTTGPGGRGNRVIADRVDRVTWGWGLAGY